MNASRIAILTAVALSIVLGAVAYWPTRGNRALELPPEWTGHVRTLPGAFHDPFGIAVAADGTIFVAEGAGAHRIRALTPGAAATIIAGGMRGFADGVGTAARFDTPSALAFGADGTLFVADTGNNAIRRIERNGQVTTIAGTGVAGFQDGPAVQARFNGPIGLAVDDEGRIFVADSYNDRIRVITRDGRVITLAGGPPGAIDGLASDARFNTPSGVAVGGDGRVFVADTGNDAIRVVLPLGVVTTIDSDAAGGVRRPIGIAVTAERVIVTEERGRIVEISGVDEGRVIAGSTSGFRDGALDESQFRNPAGVAVAEPGRLLVADAGNGSLRSIATAAVDQPLVPGPPRVGARFDADVFALQPLLWPLDPQSGPFEVAGTMGEARSEGGARFHAGIDIRADAGTDVLAVRDGVVTSPLATGDTGSINEWLRIGPIAYIHVRAGRRGQSEVLDTTRFVATRDERNRIVRMRVKRGATFRTGDTIATVNPFNHVHLNVGWPGQEENPLRFRLPQFTDTIRPTIAAGGVRFFDEAGRALSHRVRNRVLLSGRVQIVVDAWDQADGNRPERRLGLYALGYQVLGADGSPAPGFETPRETIRFDRLGSPEAPRLVYAAGSGIPFYGARRTRFLYQVTTAFRGGSATAGAWDTSLLTPGDYTVRIHARDFTGNVALANRDVAVTILAGE